jgi:protein TonB
VKLADVAPIYPVIARNAHIQGVVILEAVLNAQGGVESVRVLRSVPTLDEAAMDAVQRWRYTPALLNGQPVPVVMTVTVNFKLQ